MKSRQEFKTIYGPEHTTDMETGGHASDIEAQRVASTSRQCARCGSALRLLKEKPYAFGNMSASQDVLVCDSCHFWRNAIIQHDLHDDLDVEDEIWYLEKVVFYDAIAKRFDVSSLNTPLNMLQHYLSKKFQDIRLVHPRKFEELIASIIREHFDCEVKLTSQTRDGGYDIYAVISDKSHLIEVKRRGSINTTEGVKAVRELLGVMLVQGVAHGMLISTASRFSHEAVITAQLAANKKAPYILELIDYSMIYDIFSIHDVSDENILRWTDEFK